MAIVTVVMPLYNKGGKIERAIRSIQKQTFSDWRLIVVDDGSTDNGPAVVDRIEDERIETVHQDNAGPGAARNTGLAMTKTGYVTFLDADDEWFPDFLEVTLKAIQENDVAMVATTCIELPKGNDTIEILKENDIEPGVFFFRGDECPKKVRAVISILQTRTVLILTDIARKYGGFFDENRCVFGEDTTFLWRIAFSEKFMIIGKSLACYHMEDSELSPLTRTRPLAPYLQDPNHILKYCPQEKHNLIRHVLDVIVLRRVAQQASCGLRIRSYFLLRRYPGTKQYKQQYRDCVKRLVPGFRTWCRIKRMFRNSVKITDGIDKDKMKVQ